MYPPVQSADKCKAVVESKVFMYYIFQYNTCTEVQTFKVQFVFL